MTRRFDIAHAALLDIGRPDLAEPVVEGSDGHPYLHPDQFGKLPLDDFRLCARAFRLGHLGDPDGIPVECHAPEETVGYAFFAACDPGDICPTVGRQHWPPEWRE